MKTCALHRFFVSWKGSKPWPRATNAHLQNCPECRIWWHDQRALEARLSERAGECEVAPGFTDRVMRNLEKPLQREAPLPLFRYIATGAAAVACLVLAVLFINRNTPETANADPVPEFQEVRLLVQKNAQVIQQLPEKMEDPLEKELALVISDTKKAFAFVADSILPADYRKGN